MKIVCRPTTRFRKLFRECWEKAYGMKCAYCTKDCSINYTVDHILPRSKGGRNSFSNMVIACYECNQAKADRDIKEFQPLLLKPLDREVRL
jgi:5-methylcytosine-specific restriction endonuclease McrA